jgi:hypothetical protein
MKRLFLGLTLILALTLFLPNAHAAVLSGWGTATVDGVINPSEWAGAATLPFTWGPSSYPGTLYMMNDATNLYVGIVVINDPDFTTNDGMVLRFDNNNLGTSLEQGDDVLEAYYISDFRDKFYDTSTSYTFDDVSGGVSNGLSSGSRVGTTNHFELSHPLNSADDDHDFSLLTGQLVGFSVQLAVNEGGGTAAYTLFGDSPTNPQLWDNDYQVASDPGPLTPPNIPPSSVAVGGIVIPSSKLSILEPYLALALIALTLFALKKKL